jgi:3-oxoadipate enol-lactonase
MERVNFRLDGPGDASIIMLAHGLAADLTMWDRNVEGLLEGGYRVLRYDARGHGDSDSVGLGCSVADLARDAIALLDKLKVERVHFCGLSMGGLVAQYLAAQYGSRLYSVVLCNTMHRQLAARAWQARMDEVREHGVDAIVEGTLARWLTSNFLLREVALCESLRAMIRRTTPQGYIECGCAVRDADQTSYLANITVPALVITGSEDLASTPKVSADLHALVRGSRMKIIEGVSHISNIERPDEFNRTLLSFVRSVDEVEKW